ncbi:MAG TPA: alpha/beta hydrolase [Candidatus Polarisedimenticolia bacterium]|nr:alpha/beta hydrolase [Candidatus Polarisedimenticolia bacterium]
MRVRSYGTVGPSVIVLHGGPGAPGYMAPVARRMAESSRVLEPLQRRSGGAPLTVALHVADLHDLVTSTTDDEQPALVGHSWGAMLALAYASAHPGHVASIVLIGCGTFDRESRDQLRWNREQRIDEPLRRRIEQLPADISDPDERLKAMGTLMVAPYSYEVESTELELERCDALGFHQTWQDALRLQDLSIHPEAFSAIDAPVLMLHGSIDPHPGAMIRASLERHLPGMVYREWERCGHYPWLERAIRDEFFDVLESWLASNRRRKPPTDLA